MRSGDDNRDGRAASPDDGYAAGRHGPYTAAPVGTPRG